MAAHQQALVLAMFGFFSLIYVLFCNFYSNDNQPSPIQSLKSSLRNIQENSGPVHFDNSKELDSLLEPREDSWNQTSKDQTLVRKQVNNQQDERKEERTVPRQTTTESNIQLTSELTDSKSGDHTVPTTTTTKYPFFEIGKSSSSDFSVDAAGLPWGVSDHTSKVHSCPKPTQLESQLNGSFHVVGDHAWVYSAYYDDRDKAIDKDCVHIRMPALAKFKSAQLYCHFWWDDNQTAEVSNVTYIYHMHFV